MGKNGKSYDEVTNGKSRGAGRTRAETNKPAFAYVNINLSDSDKEIIAGKELDAVRLLDWILRLTVDGYKVSVSYDDNSDCFIVSVTSTRPTNGDYNRCVTSRSNELERAYLTALYKFEVLLMGGAIPAPVDAVRGSVWD